MIESRGTKAIMETGRDDQDPSGEDGEPEAAEEADVPDTYEYLRDAPWQGAYGDPYGNLEPGLDEDPGDGTAAEPWPDDTLPDESWPEDPWLDDPWPDDPSSGEPRSEDLGLDGLSELDDEERA